MVKATVNGDVANFESIIEISPHLSEKIKKNPGMVKAWLNDMHVEHFLSIMESGVIISKLGCSVQSEFIPLEEVAKLIEKHKTFLSFVEHLPTEFEDEAIDADEEPVYEQDANNNDNEEPLLGFLIIPIFV